MATHIFFAKTPKVVDRCPSFSYICILADYFCVRTPKENDMNSKKAKNKNIATPPPQHSLSIF